VKREKAEPLLDDVALCAQMGWTHEELTRQPVRFVEKLQIYLGTIADKQIREQEHLEEEVERLRRMER
jgi:phosphoglycerate-specific signal transduction histidine kinase